MSRDVATQFCELSMCNSGHTLGYSRTLLKKKYQSHMIYATYT